MSDKRRELLYKIIYSMTSQHFVDQILLPIWIVPFTKGIGANLDRKQCMPTPSLTFFFTYGIKEYRSQIEILTIHQSLIRISKVGHST